MSNYSAFTSESVSEGHPDKLADQISDAVVDAMLREDPESRIALETMVKTGMAIVAGEVRTSTYVDLKEIIREVILDIGYNSSDVGFDGASCAIINAIGKQSSDIAMGVDEAGDKELGIVFDEATSSLDNDTERAVMEVIENIGEELTVIIVAYRLTTLKNCRQIVELENGKITRMGSYTDIVDQSA
jgi:S-adenosylmethionine synthetase